MAVETLLRVFYCFTIQSDYIFFICLKQQNLKTAQFVQNFFVIVVLLVFYLLVHLFIRV